METTLLNIILSEQGFLAFLVIAILGFIGFIIYKGGKSFLIIMENGVENFIKEIKHIGEKLSDMLENFKNHDAKIEHEHKHIISKLDGIHDKLDKKNTCDKCKK